MASEPMITCPTCRAEIKLTESLAAPLIASTRQDYERKLAQKDIEAAQRERKLAEREALIAKERETLDQQVAEKVKSERAKIATDEARKAKLALNQEFDEKIKEIAELQDVLKQRDVKLADAQKAQAELIRKQRELDDAKREMELTIEKRVSASLDETRVAAKKEAEEHLSLKVLEREQMIASLQRQIEELKRKAEQGSQQLQGEVLELQLESMLTAKFPHDRIDAVPKGEHGGDVLHRVVLPTGAGCGTILWETKRTKNWVDGWLPKLRDDQRAAKAEIAVIVSAALPKGVETFDQIDGIWVTHPRAILPVALSLRQMLIEVNCARQATEGQQTKMEMVYQYLTGSKFRLRVQAIVEAFTTMQDDLQKERKAITRAWAKREEQIVRVMEATTGMYGELQGIAGKTLQEIDGLDVKLLEADSAAEPVPVQ
jgi:hypothetical protein